MQVQGYEPAQEKKETEEKVQVTQLWLTLEVRMKAKCQKFEVYLHTKIPLAKGSKLNALRNLRKSYLFIG